jgi:hypothetical protein
MKTLALIGLLLAATLPTFAQAPADSSAEEGRRLQRQRHFGRETVDGAAIPASDSSAFTTRRTGRLNDRFIDADGDGICDERSNGLGFKHGFGGGASASHANGKRMKGKK